MGIMKSNGRGDDVHSREEISRAEITILAVDDEPAVLMTVRAGLESYGYRVLEALDSETALRIAESHHDPIALLVLDVVMPKRSGPEVAKLVRAARPDTKVLYMSGFSTEVTASPIRRIRTSVGDGWRESSRPELSLDHVVGSSQH